MRVFSCLAVGLLGPEAGLCSMSNKYYSSVNNTTFYIQSVRNRLLQKIPIFPDLTTMLTGHRKISSYLHRFGQIDNPMCSCEEEEEQTVDHLIFKCKKLTL